MPCRSAHPFSSNAFPVAMEGDGTPATLTTGRLRVRPLEVTDAEALFTIKSDPSVTRCYGQEPHPSIDRTREWVARSIGGQERGAVLYWTLELREDRKVIGACCLWNFNDSRTCAEIGYELHPGFWGRGIMTEALIAIVDHAFDDLGLHRIEANPLASNSASIGILLKLGFRREGVLRQRQLVDGRFVDQWYLGLLKGERAGR